MKAKAVTEADAGAVPGLPNTMNFRQQTLLVHVLTVLDVY